MNVCDFCGVQDVTVKVRRFSPYADIEDRTPLCDDCHQDVVSVYQGKKVEP